MSLISRTSFTRDSNRLSYDTIRVNIWKVLSLWPGVEIKDSRNISDVLRGVLNSCEIVDVYVSSDSLRFFSLRIWLPRRI